MSARNALLHRAVLGLAWSALVAFGGGCGGAHEWLMGDAVRIVTPPQLSASQLEAARKQRDPASPRMTALLVLGAQGTEVTDLLAPYEILASSGRFDVFTVAAGEKPLPITGALATVPDYTLADAPAADLIVVPAVVDPGEEALQQWLAQRASQTRLLLSICEGARLVAAAGLLDGRRATTHFFALGGLQQQHPEVEFRPGHRYVHDGNLVSSAGVSASLDATLYAVEQLAGREAAERAAAEVGHAWIEEDDPAAEREREPDMQIGASDVLRLLRNTTLHRRSQRNAVLVYEGVSEIGLAALVDTLPRSLTIWLETVSEERAPLRTQHGMSLIASIDAASLGEVDLVIVPPGREAWSAAQSPAMARAIAASGARVESFGAERSAAAVRRGLALVASQSGPADAELVAKMIEHPYALTGIARAGEAP